VERVADLNEGWPGDEPSTAWIAYLGFGYWSTDSDWDILFGFLLAFNDESCTSGFIALYFFLGGD